MRCIIFSLLFSMILHTSSVLGSDVIELDSRIIGLKEDEPWLVMFYAPWCGHCRHLEPIYKEVAHELHTDNSPVRIGRVDAAHLQDVASHFGVHGFPTVKYLFRKLEFTHSGDRSKKDILKFVKLSHGPAVLEATSIGRFQEILGDIKDNVYFMLITPSYVAPSSTWTDATTDQGQEDAAKSNLAARQLIDFVSNNSKLRSQVFIVSGAARVLSSSMRAQLGLNETLTEDVDKAAEFVGLLPAFVVFKDDNAIRFTGALNIANNESLVNWIRSERFETYPVLTASQLWQMYDLSKFLVLFVVNHSTDATDVSSVRNERFFRMGYYLAFTQRHKWSSICQFGAMHDLQSAASLALAWHLPAPNLLILKPETHQFYLMEQWTNESVMMTLTVSDVESHMEAVLEGRVRVYGGVTFVEKLKRVTFDFITGFIDFVITSPLLALLVMGLPTGVISLLCYAICCMEDRPEQPEEDDEEDDVDGEPVHPQIANQTCVTEDVCRDDAAKTLQKSVSDKKED